MLKKIVFILVDSQQAEKAAAMKRNMGADGEIVDVWEILPNLRTDDGKVSFMEKGNCTVGGLAAKKEKSINTAEGTIFVTDAGKILRELKERGDYVIALLHENNREEDLSQSPYAVMDIEELSRESFEQAYLRLAGKPWTIMETKRCIIREMTVEDVDDFYEIYAEPSITRYMDKLYDEPEDEKQYMREYIEKIYGFYGYGLWSIICKEDGKVIGRAGLSWREGFDIPELGFVIAVPYQRKGYAYEVCRAVIEYGKEELMIPEIQALVKKGNTASVNLCTKLGFIWKDRVEDKGEEYERYVIKADDGLGKMNGKCEHKK